MRKYRDVYVPELVVPLVRRRLGRPEEYPSTGGAVFSVRDERELVMVKSIKMVFSVMARLRLYSSQK